MEITDYYNEFVVDMRDLLLLEDGEIPSQGVWRDVWNREHSNLVMRAAMNVDTKDNVSVQGFTPCTFN